MDQGFEKMVTTVAQTMEPLAPEVLFIDDDKNAIELGRLAFEECGIKITTATGGAYALGLIDAKVSSGQKPFDLIFLDIRMPDLHGMAVLRYIRAVASSVPIVLMSAITDTKLLNEATKISYVGFIQKPLTVEMVRQILTAHKFTVKSHDVGTM